MNISSPVFMDGGRIPARYTADGEDISPPLYIQDVPEEAESLVLIVDDPDAPMGTWDHWVIFNIPPDTEEIEENVAPDGVPGKNDFGTTEYGGPAPPSGIHRYRFKIYALDKLLDLPENSPRKGLEEAMEGHIIEEDVHIGQYSRE